jgi:hypothetical protein
MIARVEKRLMTFHVVDAGMLQATISIERKTHVSRSPCTFFRDPLVFSSFSFKSLVSKRAKVCQREKYVRRYQMNERGQTCWRLKLLLSKENPSVSCFSSSGVGDEKILSTLPSLEISLERDSLHSGEIPSEIFRRA